MWDVVLRIVRSVSSFFTSRIQLTRGPYQIAPPITSPLKVGHDTVHDVWLRREKIDGIDIWITLPLVLDLFDI